MDKFRIPLLYDHHNHPEIYAAFRKSVRLNDVCSKEEALEMLRSASAEMIIGQGWNDSRYSFTKKELNSLAPVLICNLSLHSFLMNDSMLEIVRLREPEIANNIEDKIWVEKNLTRILGFISSLEKFDEENTSAFLETLAGVGIWKIDDMFVSEVLYIDFLLNRGVNPRVDLWTSLEIYNSLDEKHKQQIKGLKLFTDGALGALTAALSRGYMNAGNGLLVYEEKTLYDRMVLCAETGKQLAVHAIGDLAVRQVTKTIGLMKRNGIDANVRIEHCQFISPENAEQLKNFGVPLSMQPNFSYDSVFYNDRLSKYYLESNNPFRMLIDRVGFEPGKDLFFGSDGMPHGVQFALEQSFFPPYSEQRLTREEFVAGYCMPDFSNGYIDVQVDEEKKRVNCIVIVDKSLINC